MRRRLLARGAVCGVLAATLLVTAGCLEWLFPSPPDPGNGTGPQPAGVLFFDDFEDGLDPAWYTTPGWSVSDGWLYSSNRTWRRAYVLEGVDWMDYAVDVDLASKSGTVGVIVRCSEDLQDYVMLRATYETIRWRVYEDGEIVEETESLSPGLFDGVNHLRVEVQGNSYRVYVEDLLRSEFSWTGLTQGMPGVAAYAFWYNAPPGFDNFRVTALE